MEKFEKIPIVQLYPTATPVALDLLEKLLSFDPMSRIDVQEALEHPYFELFHDPDDEVTLKSQKDFLCTYNNNSYYHFFLACTFNYG